MPDVDVAGPAHVRKGFEKATVRLLQLTRQTGHHRTNCGNHSWQVRQVVGAEPASIERILARRREIVEDGLMRSHVQALPQLRLLLDRSILRGLPESPEIRREIVYRERRYRGRGIRLRYRD